MAARKSQGKRRGMTAQEKRAKYAPQRAALSKLKAKGLISPKANLRKAKPSSGLLKKLELLKPVLSGNAQAVKLSPKQRADYEEAGFTTTRGFTLIRKNANERVVVDSSGRPEVKPISSKVKELYRRIVLPANVQRFDRFTDWVEANPAEFEALVGGPSAQIGFTYDGHQSRRFMGPAEIREYLKNYTPIFGDGDGSESGEGETFKSLELYVLSYEGMIAASMVPRHGDGPGGAKKKRTYVDETGRTTTTRPRKYKSGAPKKEKGAPQTAAERKRKQRAKGKKLIV